MRFARPGLVLLACLVIASGIAACGDGGDDNDSTTDQSGQVGGDNKGSLGPATVMRLTYSDGTDQQTARLTCSDGESDGTGYLADRAPAACREVNATGKSLFERPPAGQACTQIYGGPETLRVQGRVDYDTVSRTFGRKDGCEIADWNKLGPLLPDGAPGKTG